jgi:protein gp37
MKIDRTGFEKWNPSTGCTHYSDGCKNCYAEKIADKLHNKFNSEKYKNNFKHTMHPGRINWPIGKKKGTEIFVNSMADVLHQDSTDEFILQVFDVMNKTPQHRYWVLTKRAERLVDLSPKITWTDNIMMGVTVESDKYLYRADLLRQTGAKFRMLSIEPLLSSVVDINLTNIDWVILGGESGGDFARPMGVNWVREVRDLCIAGDIPFYFKQWGHRRNNPDQLDPTLGRARGGRFLDGKEWRELPPFFTI